MGEVCCKNERGGGEERGDQLSYYKKDRTDIMNEWARKTSRQRVESVQQRNFTSSFTLYNNI